MIDVKKLADLGNQVVVACGDDVLGFRVDMFPRKCSIHLGDDAFKEIFGQGMVESRDDETFPFEHSAEVGGVKFFCIGDETI